MKKIGEGLASNAYLMDDTTVLLVAKGAEVFDESYRGLKRNLDLLDGKIKSVVIPGNAKLVEPSDEYPLGQFRFHMCWGAHLILVHATMNKNVR